MKIKKNKSGIYHKVNCFGMKIETLEFGSFRNTNSIFNGEFDPTVYRARIVDKSGHTLFTDEQHAIIQFFDLPRHILKGK